MENWIERYFTGHPKTVDESYFEHLCKALSFSSRLLFAGLACLTHALVPGLCTKTGSKMIDQLYKEMVTQRSAKQSEVSKGNLVT